MVPLDLDRKRDVRNLEHRRGRRPRLLRRARAPRRRRQPGAGSVRHEHRPAPLADGHVEDRVVLTRAEVALVGDQDPPTEERRAGGCVEGDLAAVVTGQRGLREALQLGAVGCDHDELGARPRGREVDAAGQGDPEPVGEVARTALPQQAQPSGPTVPDRHPVELAGGRVRLAQTGGALLRHQQRAAVRSEEHPRGPEVATVEAPVREPDPGPAPSGRHTPDHGLAVVGDVELAARAPGGEVRDRRLVELVRGAARRRPRPAGREVAEGRVAREPTGPRVQQQCPGGGPLQHHQPSTGVTGGDLDAVGLRQVLAGDGPRAQQRAPGGPLAHARPDLVARGVVVGPRVDAVVRVGVDERRVAGGLHPGEDAGVPARSLGLCRGGHRRPGRRQRTGQEGYGRGDGGDRSPHSRSSTSRAARSPARTAPSM